MRHLNLRQKLLLLLCAPMLPLGLALAVMVSRTSGTVALGTAVVGLIMLSVILGVVLTFVAARSLTMPIDRLNAAYDAVAAGDLDVDVPVMSSDEMGRLTDAFNRTIEELRNTRTRQMEELGRAGEMRGVVTEYGRFAEAIARGDLTARVRAATKDPELRALGANLNRMAESLGALSGRVRTAASQMAGATNQILAVVSQNAGATSEQAASVAETSVTIDEVRASARQVAERATDLASQAEGAMAISADGNSAVEDIVTAMNVIHARVDAIASDILSLSEQTQAIESITRSVNDLADQSNMLALNATIEAARAGEQGKGFAVVAQEVRSLAEQSKAATSQVQMILGEIQRATAAAVIATEEGTKAVEDGVGRAHRAGDAINRMDATIRETAHFATSIAASVREQHVGMDQIAQAMSDVTSSSVQMATGASDTQSAAELLSELARQLEELTGNYRVDSPQQTDDTSVPAAVPAAAPAPRVAPVPVEAAASPAWTPDYSDSLTFGDLADRLASMLRVDCAVLVAFRDGAAVPVGTHLPAGQTLPPFSLDGKGAVATVFRTAAPARVDDYRRIDGDDVAAAARAGNYRSSVAVPIIVNGTLWGAVLSATTGDTPIPRGAEGLLARFAREASRIARGSMVPA